MRMWFGLTLMALNAGKKWLLVALPVVAGVVVAGLWIGGAFSGSPAEPLAAPGPAVAPTPAPTPEPTPEPSPTRVPTSTPFPTPTAHPSPEGPTATPLPPPTPMAAPRIEVPVYLTGATNVGSLEFVLVYEPSVLEVVSVEKGTLARTALIDSGSRTAGRVWTAVIDTNGISGNGPVAVVSFNVVGNGVERISLTLESVYAYNATSLLDIVTEASAGSFTLESKAVISPGLSFPR
ncbi:MAG: hypothetical protein J4O03_06335 [Chloroflexi bacterium]|nr:hypothetical protein [Chloroflexota bacterium]MCI0793072.1 hypothetical protein [Chloroflexota bacterium]MCI0859811.1 hypothetical protein [Chloroflexota bacterium]MCI0877946.1 hypothetical protein [Chloroflexota bacterium]MCI0894341.1 hypothetical protein [Chloroflexota bacterium]